MFFMSKALGGLGQHFSTARPWHQLSRAARDSPGIDSLFKCNFIFVNMPQHTHNYINSIYDHAKINY